MSIDLLALLVVILTITFASVANMHLTLNRLLIGSAPGTRSAADDVREEINGNAWVLFWAFVTAAIALLLKGAFAGHSSWLALTYASCIIVVTLNTIVLHDIYQAMFALTTIELPLPRKPMPETEDFSS
nr:hypothetical protein [Polymorphobacter sp.]